MVKGMRELPYEDRLRRLNIFSLERHWPRGDNILTYNIFHGRPDLPQVDFFERSETFEATNSICATGGFGEP